MQQNRIKGKIFDIQHFCYQDGPGIRTTIFLHGCPLRCPWCHNPECQADDFNNTGLKEKTGRNAIREIHVDEALKAVLEDKDFYRESGGGVTISGGEPMLQTDFVCSLLDRCSELQIHTAIETTGFCDWKHLDLLAPHTDLFLFDLKLVSPTMHSKWTGVDNAVILDNLVKLKTAGQEIIVRTPLIAGVNDHEEFAGILTFLRRYELTRMTIIPYHELWVAKFRSIYGKEPQRFRVMKETELNMHRQMVLEYGLQLID